MRRVYFWLLIACIGLGCEKTEPTAWNSRIHAPIAYAELDFSDFVNDSLINDTGTQLALHVEQNVFSLNFDSLFTIPPDTVFKTFTIPLFSLDIPPGVSVFTDIEEYNFSQLEVQLRKAEIRNGQLRVRASNSAAGALLFTYRVPGATRGGSILEVMLTVPGRKGDEPGQGELLLDISDYEIDLQGPSGNEFNTLSTEFRLLTPTGGDGVTLTNKDEVLLWAEYSEIELNAAEGYFGSEEASFSGEGLRLELPEGINEAMLNLPNARARLDLTNTIGADFSASITSLTAHNLFSGQNLNLEAPFIEQTINLERAVRLGGFVQPTTRQLLANESNSNLPALISLLPDSLSIEGSVTLNPLGNISNFNDFTDASGRISADMSLDIPLVFSIEGLLLRDSIALEVSANSTPERGLLYMHIINGFPIEAELRITALQDSGNTIALNDYLMENDHAAVPEGWAVVRGEEAVSRLRYQLPEDILSALLESSTLVLEIRLATSHYPELIEIKGDEKVQVFISTESEWNVEIQ